jgi:hypothetical protein
MIVSAGQPEQQPPEQQPPQPEPGRGGGRPPIIIFPPEA